LGAGQQGVGFQGLPIVDSGQGASVFQAIDMNEDVLKRIVGKS